MQMYADTWAVIPHNGVPQPPPQKKQKKKQKKKKTFATALKANTSLKALNVSACFETVAECAELAAGLSGNATLRELLIYESVCGVEGLKHVVEASRRAVHNGPASTRPQPIKLRIEESVMKVMQNAKRVDAVHAKGKGSRNGAAARGSSGATAAVATGELDRYMNLVRTPFPTLHTHTSWMSDES